VTLSLAHSIFLDHSAAGIRPSLPCNLRAQSIFGFGYKRIDTLFTEVFGWRCNFGHLLCLLYFKPF